MRKSFQLLFLIAFIIATNNLFAQTTKKDIIKDNHYQPTKSKIWQ